MKKLVRPDGQMLAKRQWRERPGQKRAGDGACREPRAEARRPTGGADLGQRNQSERNQYDFSGRHAVVTGGAAGI
ncbi:MAG: hypothetical protein ACTHKB_06455, partial [Burkholderiaceae bacterium]